MGDSEDTNKPQAPPAWQMAQPSPSPSPEEPRAETTDTNVTSTLEQARKFLQDPDVQKETAERKAEFLRGKGIPQSDINELLKDSTQEAYAEPQTEPETLVVCIPLRCGGLAPGFLGYGYKLTLFPGPREGITR